MGEKTQIDISQCSFDEFITFLFDRDVPAKTQKWNPWYWKVEVTYDPRSVCTFYVRLFRQPGFLMKRFSKAQLEQGFWAIPSANLGCSVYRLIWDTDLPFAAREECVKSMVDLFAGLFATEPLDTSVQMWWDSLCYDWHCGTRDRQRGGEDLVMQDVMFLTLSDILALDSTICRGAALHGLGHLHHPDTDQLVQRYLRQNPALSSEARDYALAAARFEVL
jgi:hypothetical protein